MPRKLILTNFQSPGDIVILTAAVRDLHGCCPGEFVTDVRSDCPDLWLHNPYLTPLADNDPEVERIECHYPLIHQSNQRPYHFIHGFMEYLSERLEVRFVPRLFHGDLHLSEEELAAPPPPAVLAETESPFWIVVAGGKLDFTIKWWDPARYQAVIDQLAGRVRFAQVGEQGHHHPALRGVLSWTCADRRHCGS